jgi:hypothetical protein
MDEGRLHEAIRDRRCWTCGDYLSEHFAFVIGPMCAVNRVSAEPPSHVTCADFSVRACPFLSRPKALRREANKPEGLKAPAGFAIPRNPGVALVWITSSYQVFRPEAGGSGVLFQIGRPHGLLWFAEGRSATRAEILDSINSGLPLLREVAEKEGPDAVAALAAQTSAALKLVP